MNGASKCSYDLRHETARNLDSSWSTAFALLAIAENRVRYSKWIRLRMQRKNRHHVNDVCTSCGNCHAGGPVPSVAFTGPATLNSGATATYTLTVSTSLKETGCDIAATDGVTLTPVGGNLANFVRRAHAAIATTHSLAERHFLLNSRSSVRSMAG